MALGRSEIEGRFGRHKAALEGPAAPEEHAKLREKWMAFAEELDTLLEDGRAKSIAFTELESASMWTHKALAETLSRESQLDN